MTVRSVQRALTLLDLLSKKTEGMSLNDIGKQLGLHVSTCHRLLNTMRKLGYVQQNIRDQQYQLGSAFFILINNWSSKADLVSVATPYVNELVEQCKETVHLSILLRNQVYDVYTKECAQRIRATASPGIHMPLYCTAVGKVLLAYQPELKRLKILQSIEIKKYTSHTIKELDVLEQDLEKIRCVGYSINNKEYFPDLSAVAAPIFNYKGIIVAALGIALPDKRFTKEQRAYLINQVMSTAKFISQKLGYWHFAMPANTQQDESL